MRNVSITALLFALITVLVGDPGAASASVKKPVPVEVRGGFVNELACVPAGAAATKDPNVYSLECWGGTLWVGGFTGHTVIHFVAKADVVKNTFDGTYEERFYGTYAGDNSFGELRTKGRFTIDALGQFIARAKIVDGSCAFKGSSGSFSADGDEFFGGYVVKWVHPKVTVAPGCVPDLPSP